MGQEMTFAQALSEARQIIVQQSSRIKSDVEKIVSMQQSIDSQAEQLAQCQSTINEQNTKLSQQSEELQSVNTKLEETTLAREQAEAIIDRQGQRLTASQATIDQLERSAADQASRIRELSGEIEQLRGRLPTAEDNEALAAFSNLLATKKVNVPSLGKISRRPSDFSDGDPSARPLAA